RSGVGDGAGCRAARCLADRSGGACSGRAAHHSSLSKLRVAVLASGRGTNLQALLDACATSDFPAQIVVVGCNRATAQSIGRAEAAGVPVCLADRAVLTNRETRQQQLLTALQAAHADLIVLAGFDEILVPGFVAAYAGKIINTHPSLLPAFGGTMHAVQA